MICITNNDTTLTLNDNAHNLHNNLENNNYNNRIIFLYKIYIELK
jgi:hypothetical protein